MYDRFDVDVVMVQLKSIDSRYTLLMTIINIIIGEGEEEEEEAVISSTVLTRVLRTASLVGG